MPTPCYRTPTRARNRRARAPLATLGGTALAAALATALAACSSAAARGAAPADGAPETAPAGAAQSSTPAGAPAMMTAADTPYVVAANDSIAGEYLTIVGGCNDCHTQRWAETDGKLPASERLTGNPVGYRGPWGTTYAANLRLIAQRAPEDRWVAILATADSGEGRPPMPWMNLRQMNSRDLRNLYRYIRSLGPAGERAPRYVPPDSEPTTPYILFVPQQPRGR